ncbi:hypothetical protein [Neorhizobium galegae]|uniref:hypothetical protein n=1 Tax=Neorhizobium galegae TaxID=399 RepID=UPI00127DCBB0|nr:hypothetical protein [Neorhizobium galegae]KAA9386902.1 hypothetical protein F4V88_10690 [Neorhizobium galegae]MCM2498043.1 hypothetical protein [Neorhizobium galegae]
MSPPPMVSYRKGMFADEPLAEDSFSAHYFEFEATCHHEAAHAVSEYVFGNSLEFVGVKTEYLTQPDGSIDVMVGGEVRRIHRSARVCVNYDYRPMLFVVGVVAAAGPAGERRYRYERGAPMRLLGASEGDHLAIDTIGKSLERRGRSRFAFRRHVWWHAQKLIAHDIVWRAISDIAKELSDTGITRGSEPDVHWRQLLPQDVYRICRRHGLKQGIARVA